MEVKISGQPQSRFGQWWLFFSFQPDQAYIGLVLWNYSVNTEPCAGKRRWHSAQWHDAEGAPTDRFGDQNLNRVGLNKSHWLDAAFREA